ncbi:MAG: bifunctional 4-hydroxy-2-oxoglutarate aldolase/2-dehydro-3-deoxy-phosphogluconate aldolase [Terrimicrobiaceae bacterium]|nr:bifunctional 4-hydroxy-2-oxoglutarate aldolase/2-dehydro-3-deoxy-phosphogluconate aldolase [Terrimicrobiaceae bacterium]
MKPPSPVDPAFNPHLSTAIESAGIVAVLVVDDASDAIPLAQALLAGGVNVMELTLRTPAALDALREIKRSVPEMLAGVGTILTTAQITAVVDAGAAFGVAPGTNPRILAAAREAGLSFAPGIATPSDIEIAIENGCKVLKLFPCEPMGGLAYLKAIAAPYAHLGLKYIPLGGINAKNMTAYLSDPLIAALGGSWLAPRELVKAANWPAITALASEAAQTIQSLRNPS